MSGNNLTPEEQVVQKYYQILVVDAKKYNEKERKKNIKEFCKEFSKASIKGTAYNKHKVIVGKQKSKTVNASMNTLGGQTKDAIFKVNVKRFMSDYKLGSNSYRDLLSGYFKLVETSNHEMTHFFQGKDNGNFKNNPNMISVGEALDFTYEDVARRLDKDFYNGKRGNYHNVMKEGDARRNGCLNAIQQFCNAIPLKEERVKWLGANLVASMNEDNVEYEKLFLSGEKSMAARNKVVKFTEYAVANDPKTYREQFPVLKFEFMKNGMRVPIEKVWQKEQELERQMRAYGDPKTIEEMVDRTRVGFAKIMYNNLKDMTEFEMTDLCKRIGKEEINNMIDFTEYGKKLELNKREEKLKKYYEVVDKNNLNGYVNEYEMDNALQSYRQKAGLGSHFDFVTQENIHAFKNEETEFLRVARNELKYMDDKPYANDAERKQAEDRVAKIRNDRLEANKRKYNERVATLKKKNRGIFKLIGRVAKNIGLLEAPAQENEYTTESLDKKVNRAFDLEKMEQEEQQEVDEISTEMKDVMERYEAQRYLDSNEKYEQKDIETPEVGEDKSI